MENLNIAMLHQFMALTILAAFIVLYHMHLNSKIFSMATTILLIKNPYGGHNDAKTKGKKA